MRQVLGRMTYARVVSTLALFIALGGGAYAVSIGKNDVGPKQIREGAVRSAEIKDHAVKGRDIAANTIGGGKIKNGSLGDADIDVEELLAGATAAFSERGSQCDPGAAHVTCGDLTLKTPVAGRILANASGTFGVGASASGTCQLTVDGRSVAVFDGGSGSYALSGVSDPVSAGDHLVQVQCLESTAPFSASVQTLSAMLASVGVR